jgi:hypothetical protein
MCHSCLLLHHPRLEAVAVVEVEVEVEAAAAVVVVAAAEEEEAAEVAEVAVGPIARAA